MPDLLTFILWALAILGLSFLASAVVAAVLDRIRLNHRPETPAEPDPDPAHLVAQFILEHIPNPGEEVWVSVRRCKEHGAVDVELLPTLKGEM